MCQCGIPTLSTIPIEKGDSDNDDNGDNDVKE